MRQPESLALGLTGAPSQRYLQRRYGPTPSVERILSQLAHEHRLERVDGWPIQSLSVYCEVFAVPEDRSVDDVIAELAADPRVELVQRMNVFDTQTSRYDDPYADLQSAAIASGSSRTRTARDGPRRVDRDHRLGRRRATIRICAAASARARSRRRRAPRARGGEVHGTAIAGIIASAMNNREGIVGVAPDVGIAALRACWAVTPGQRGRQMLELLARSRARGRDRAADRT